MVRRKSEFTGGSTTRKSQSNHNVHTKYRSQESLLHDHFSAQILQLKIKRPLLTELALRATLCYYNLMQCSWDFNAQAQTEKLHFILKYRLYIELTRLHDIQY